MAHKVVIVGLENLNLGDRIIEDTCKYLVKEINPDFKIKIMNLFPPEDILNQFEDKYSQALDCIQSKNYNDFLSQLLLFWEWYKFQKKGSPAYEYYETNLKKSKMVIIAGGGLIKYSRENFWNALYSIISYCNKARIHVYFNAIGVEGFDSKNFYCQLLKYSLNKKCVKLITTRDDIETLKKYFNKKDAASQVGDPALWAQECYKLEGIAKNDIIGIGLIRGKIFSDYGIDFSQEQIQNCYIALIKNLEQRGYRWQLFSNGLKSDYRMGKDILECLGLPVEEKYLAPRPVKPKSLVTRIAGYKAVIAARLHANIVAAAYNVPSVGFVWNDKLKFFGEQLGCGDRFLDKEDFSNPEIVINQLEKAIETGYDTNKIMQLKSSTKESLKAFIYKELGNCKK